MLTSIQSTTLRAQFSRIARTEGDEGVVAFATENNDILNSEEFADLAKLAEQAYDRLEEAKKVADEVARQTAEEPKVSVVEAPVVTKTKEEKRAEGRARLIYVLTENQYDQSAKAVRSDISSLNGKEANAGAKYLRQAIRDGKCRLGSEDKTRVAIAIAFQLEARAKACAESSVLFFLGGIIRAFVSLTTAETIGESILKGAERTLSLAKPSNEWSPWALDALDRLIVSPTPNEVNQFPFALDYKSKAPELIDRLVGDLHDAIVQHHEANAKARAQKEVDRRSRQLERAAISQRMRGSNAKANVVGKGKKSKRANNDPHRNGK